MKLLQDCWIALLELFNLATFSTTGRSSLQQALQQPYHQLPLPEHASQPPIFNPPSGPEDPESTFKCDYSALGSQWVPCSTPGDRKCWLAGPAGKRFDINSDYETIYPTGITRKVHKIFPSINHCVDLAKDLIDMIFSQYHLIVNENTTLDADGLVMPYAKLFNNTYPGPWIQACWGDIIEVTVENQLDFNGTSIHWHGIRQLESLEMDGVNAVTQCPIAPKDKFTYRFRAMQYGTSWYHSHYSLQYGDGLAGPLTIHGPSATEYDYARDPILMTDWNHRSGFMDFQQELLPQPNPPLMDSILLNGQGSYAGGGKTGHQWTTVFKKGKRYLLRLINTSVDTTFIFSIDNHNITVVSSDFVPIHPYTTDHVVVGIGQRYHVVVTAIPKETTGPNKGVNSTANDFWVRTIPATGCSGFPAGGSPDERQGIIHYGNQPRILPTSQRNNYTSWSLACRDEPYDKLVPIIPWTIGSASNTHEGQFGDLFGVGLQRPDPGQGKPQPNDSFNHWALGANPLYLNFSNPTILNLNNKTFNPDYVVIPEDYPEGSWVYLLITADPFAASGPRRLDIPASHPIHLHGHDFALLQQSTRNLTVNPPKPKLDNPPRRDVTLLPSGGYIIIAFKADNPGVWLMHCHIAWHASSGLALQILERQEKAQQQLTPARLKETRRVCDNWNTWFANPKNHYNPSDVKVFQDDSGI
ncbi:hypothetical protein MMC07_005914 [Pseudocyphellaria aurata]|nr:hypothetical protein [Pseudocyphellaria aurata]